MQLARFCRLDGQSQFGMLDGMAIRPIGGNIFSQWQVTEERVPLASVALLAPMVAAAQNVAIVNGKPVPKARVDALWEDLGI